MFTKCRRMCYPNPNVPKKSLTTICCPGFLRSRAQALRFKMTWIYLSTAEQQVQGSIFKMVSASLILSVLTGIIVPFALITQMDGSGIMLPIVSYAMFAGIQLIFSLVELNMISSIKKLLVNDENESEVSFNFYLLIKWIEGNMCQLSAFSHICFGAGLIGQSVN